MQKAPCKDCPDHWATKESNCHVGCERYATYAQRRSTINEKRHDVMKNSFQNNAWYKDVHDHWRKGTVI